MHRTTNFECLPQHMHGAIERYIDLGIPPGSFLEAALETGELSEAATKAISTAFEEVFDRNRRLANILLSDKQAMEQFTSFWFALSYAEVRANQAYNDAFRRAREVV